MKHKDSNEFKPCPFCGTEPHFETYEEYAGTYYEMYCHTCNQSGFSYQLSNFMTIEERCNGWIESKHKYKEEYFNRVRDMAIRKWNTRAN